MNLYLLEKATPGSEVLRRACVRWKLSFSVEGATVDSGSFHLPQPNVAVSTQMSLFKALSDVKNQQLDVKILQKRRHSIDLKVSIDFSKTGTEPLQ